MKKVSVLVPVHNSSKYLEKCIESLVNQTLDDIEIIMVNDGSTDNSEKIIKSYERRYKNLKYIYKENSGVADTRNILIKQATGEYIGFVDSDDIISLDMYEKMYHCALKDNADIVVCGINEVHETFTKKNSGLFNNDINEKFLMPPSLCNKLIKKELFVGLYFPNIMIGEDITVVIKILNKTNKISYVNEYLYNYYKRENSIMNQNKYNSYWNDVFIVYDYIKKEINDEKIVEFIFIQHLLRDSSIKFMYYKEGTESLNIINNIAKTNYPNYYKNKYFKTQNWRYKLICHLIYHKQYWLVKLIRKVLNSEK